MIADICMVIITASLVALVSLAIRVEMQVWREAKEWERRNGKR